VKPETPATASKPRRVRAPEAHRAAILAAARSVFAERGYAKATIREIAQRVGVTHGLVAMHFPTKECLFLAAVPGAQDLSVAVPGALDGLPERIARMYVASMETSDQAEALIALIRGVAADHDAASALMKAMRDKTFGTFQTVLRGPDAERRFDLLGAHLIGVTFSRYVVPAGPLASMPPDELIEHLTASVTVILFGTR